MFHLPPGTAQFHSWAKNMGSRSSFRDVFRKWGYRWDGEGKGADKRYVKAGDQTHPTWTSGEQSRAHPKAGYLSTSPMYTGWSMPSAWAFFSSSFPFTLLVHSLIKAEGSYLSILTQLHISFFSSHIQTHKPPWAEFCESSELGALSLVPTWCHLGYALRFKHQWHNVIFFSCSGGTTLHIILGSQKRFDLIFPFAQL